MAAYMHWQALTIIDKPLRPPASEDARIKILVTPVCQDDVACRVGNRPFLPKLPFTPGYTAIGTVDAVGENVTEVSVGDRVAALTNYGCYAEYLYWPAQKLVKVPETIDPAQASILILNYLVSYQILHRVAHVKTGDKVLIIGASGGVGTAFLELGQLANIKMYGLASLNKHNILKKFGAIPIDYHTQDFVEILKKLEPEGIDFVFNGMSEEYFSRAMVVLRPGGVLVHYGAPTSFLNFLQLVAKLLFYNVLPNGKKIEGYGTHRLGVELFKEDWSHLFKLLQDGRIHPIISEKFPLLEAAKANEMLESGQVTGNLVLLSPELMNQLGDNLTTT